MTSLTKTFIIDYRIHCRNGDTFHPAKMKVKNCTNEFFAKVKLEKHIEGKYDGYLWMEIIDCREDIVGMQWFNDIFKGKGR